jgi:DNA repair exonuclease SbcCD nuclease subunit
MAGATQLTIRFLHAADIHLDSPLRGLDSEAGAPAGRIRNATRRALGRLVDLALEEDVAFLLIAGDIYDGDWQEYRTGIFFAQQMARLTREGKRVIAIRGNHDAENRMSRSLRLPDGVVLLDHERPQTVALPELGIAVHGQSFATREVTDNLVRAYPRPLAGMLNIGMLHTCLEDGGSLHRRYAPCSRADLESLGYEYWALGHIHAREVVSKQPWIVFPGNLQGRHINEPGAKGATLVTVAAGRVVAAEHRSVDDFRWARITADLTGCASEAAALQTVSARLAEALAAADGRGLAVRVTLAGATTLHGGLADLHEKLQWEARALSDFLWVEGIERQTRPVAGPALPARGDALGALARRIAALAEAPGETLLGDWPAQLLGRLPPDILPADHAIHHPADILARARDLLLARLEEG